MKSLPRFVAMLLAAFTVTALADDFQVDAAHAYVGFEIDHLVIHTVRGRFTDLAGTIGYDPATGKITGAQATIQVKSIDTGIDKRDEHLRSPDFFDAAKFPVITYQVKKVVEEAGKQVLVGDFTIRDVTRELRLPVTVKGPITDPWGKQRLAIRGTATIDRTEYGLTWSKTLETGGLMVGKEVTLVIDFEAAK